MHFRFKFWRLWSLDDHLIHFEAHLNFKDNLSLNESTQIIISLENTLKELFSIEDIMFQCEYQRDDDKSLIPKIHHH